jgi:hypothetical protein
MTAMLNDRRGAFCCGVPCEAVGELDGLDMDEDLFRISSTLDSGTGFGDNVGDAGEAATTPSDEDDDVDSPSPFAMVVDDVVGDMSWSFKEDGTNFPNTLALFLISPTVSAEVEDEITGCDSSTEDLFEPGSHELDELDELDDDFEKNISDLLSRDEWGAVLGLCLVWLNCV